MRKKKFIKKVGLILLAAILTVQAAFFVPTEVKADSNNSGNRMNVVFVMDASGSMDGQTGRRGTDEDGLRFEAMELFTALAADNGNYMGAVVFDHEIVASVDVQEMTSKADKERLVNAVRNVKRRAGDTAIGTALREAVNMITTQGNKNLPSVIVYLSDGNTDFEPKNDPNGDLEKQSDADKAAAISNAVAQGIPVYSVCLNDTNSGFPANPDELREISDQTGGRFQEVNNADGLQDVFKMFYGLIYGTDSIGLGTVEIPAGEEKAVTFTIPALGVEEANIVISTGSSKAKIKAYLQEPGSTDRYSDSEMDALTTNASSFVMIKITQPVSGEWTLYLTGDKNATVDVNLVYNHDLDLELQEGSNGNVAVGQPIPMTAVVTDKGTVITDMSVFANNPVHLQITGKNSGFSDDVIMSGNGVTCDFTPNAPDEYELVAYIDIDGYHEESNKIVFSLVNSAPSASDFEIKKTITPFSKAEKVSLSFYAKDQEDSDLTYAITDSSLNEGSFKLNGDQLEVEVAKSGSGKIKLTATDSYGESVEFTCTVKVFNILIPIIIGVVLLLVAAGVVILLLTMKKNNAVVQGSIRVIPFSQGMMSMQETIDGDKGKMILGRYLDGRVNTGINYFQSYFQAEPSNPNYIYFVSKQGYTTDYNPDVPSKKIRLDSQLEITIYGSEDHSCGIRVTYVGFNGGFGF